MDTNSAAQQGAQGAQGFPGGQGGPPGGPPPGGLGGRGGLMFLGPWGGIVAVALLVLTYVVVAVAFWQFLKKAGLTPMVALLMLVPVVNLGVALWAAFAEWPISREIERLKLAAASADLISGANVAAAHDATAPLSDSAPAG